ncbi:MAG: branched-chain amino acid aminotransferase [Oscillospiraceae bacterium]|nr:branched-chain amino acid aminotransferase [Oscillospiraceae bacterium]
MEQIRIQLTENPKQKPNMDTMPFGKIYTDHMFVMNYTEGVGWHDARIVPYGPFTLDPATMVFHYAQEIFEGLKAYRTDDGHIQLFRPIDNFNRMNDSAERMCMAKVDPEFCVEALKKLVEIDADWVPTAKDTSLYVRPFMFADEVGVGVHASKTYIFCMILSPSGSYYSEGINPVKIMIEDQDVRAVRGGTGFTKCGGNYAGSLRAADRAAEKGFSQVLWLDGVEMKYVEEVGAMNIMFKIDGKVCTPSCHGTVLPGITRRSILQIAREWGYDVEERLISADELVEAAENGKLEEIWGTGTAAVISPVGEIAYKGKSYVINGGKIGELTQKLYDELTGIQWGRIPDTRGWIVKVK